MANVLVEESSLQAIADAIRYKTGGNDTYKPREMAPAIRNLPGTGVLQNLSVTENGNYAPEAGVDGFDYVSVAVPGGFEASDEGKVIVNGALIPQTSLSVSANGTYDTTDKNSVVVVVPAAGFAFVNVTNHTGAIVTVTDGITILTGDSSIEQVFLLPNAGTWTIAAGDKSSVVVVSTRGTAHSVTIGELQLVPWSSGTDEQIAAMIKAAHDGTIDLQEDAGWSLGDSRAITMNEFTALTTESTKTIPSETRNIIITSFDDYESCGCVLQFDFDSVGSMALNDDLPATSAGRYASTPFVTTIIDNIVSSMPNWLSALLIPFCVHAGTGTLLSEKKLALRSLIEYTGQTKSGQYGSDYGTYMLYYQSHPKANGYWTRTQRQDTTWASNYRVGGQNAASINSDYPVAPFGCL